MKRMGCLILPIIGFVLAASPTTALENPNSLLEEAGATEEATPKTVTDRQSVETLILSPEDMSDGKSYPILDLELALSRQEDSWTFSLVDPDGKIKESVSMPTSTFDGKELDAKFVITAEGDDLTMKVSAGDYLQVSHGQLLNGRHYSCPQCGLIVVVSSTNDQEGYVCPNDGTKMVKDPAKHSKVSIATFIDEPEEEQ